MIEYKNNSLSHHGILGQKWGVRRYQNPDGTLTEAGHERYRKGDARDYIAKGNRQQGSATMLGISGVTNLATGVLAANAGYEAGYLTAATALKAIGAFSLGAGAVTTAAAIGVGIAAVANKKIGEAKYKDLTIRYKQAANK